jgi:hypothetical protein
MPGIKEELDCSLKKINGTELKQYIESKYDNETVFLTIDDYYTLSMLYGIEQRKHLLIWAHYFVGHRFIFHRYNEIDPLFNISQFNIIFRKIAEMVPIQLLRILMRKYIKTLSSNYVVSQSVFTDLLLERVYAIRTMGILSIPVASDAFPMNISSRSERILIFLGNFDETDLGSLFDAIKVIKKEMNPDGFDFFGTEQTGNIFQKHYNIKMNYIGKLSAEELAHNYQTHCLTICPIYNGTFEMVPIESLLSGTPVISFIQPFIEVTGQSLMVANILNSEEIRSKILNWKNLDAATREKERSKILDIMESQKVSEQLASYAKDIIKNDTPLKII